MPIEWNILMVYGGIFLFGFHPEASVLGRWASAAAGSSLFSFFCLVVIPCYGNFRPSKVSFLLAMRYYAGNWAYNIWLFRGDSAKKLKKLRKASGTLREQLEKLLPDTEAVESALALSLAHRFMHLEGRPLFEALPEAVDSIEDYEWMDGEILGGMVLGWNFGDGHLNHSRLLEAVQAQCGFEAGELRVVMVESQPLFGRTMAWKAVDAATGLVAEGETAIAPMRALQPWPTGAYAQALGRAPSVEDEEDGPPVAGRFGWRSECVVVNQSEAGSGRTLDRGYAQCLTVSEGPGYGSRSHGPRRKPTKGGRCSVRRIVIHSVRTPFPRSRIPTFVLGVTSAGVVYVSSRGEGR